MCLGQMVHYNRFILFKDCTSTSRNIRAFASFLWVNKHYFYYRNLIIFLLDVCSQFYATIKVHIKLQFIYGCSECENTCVCEYVRVFVNMQLISYISSLSVNFTITAGQAVLLFDYRPMGRMRDDRQSRAGLSIKVDCQMFECTLSIR